MYSPIDLKPKTRTPEQLQRIKDVRENPFVSVIVDVYSENWRKLCYVIVHGQARILRVGLEHRQAVASLRKKYHQYLDMKIDERPIIKIIPKKMVAWQASPAI